MQQEEDEVEQEIHGIKLVKRVNVSFKCRVDFFTRVKESPEEISFEGCAVVQRETSRAAAKLIKSTYSCSVVCIVYCSMYVVCLL